MLLLHRQRHAARTPQEQHVLAAQIEAKDRQIDRLEYALCGLTVEEIRIVEGRKMGWALAVEEGKWSMVNGQRSIVNFASCGCGLAAGVAARQVLQQCDDAQRQANAEQGRDQPLHAVEQHVRFQ